jgi:hypothetical protein
MPPVTQQTNIPETAGQAADRIQNEARALETQTPSTSTFQRRGVEPTVSADTLANPPQRVTLPQPTVATQPSQFVQDLDPAIQNGKDTLVRAQTDQASQRDDLLGRLLGNDTGSSQNTFNETFRSNFSQDQTKQLEDANVRLAQLQGKFRTQAQDVSGARGQSKVFEQAQLGELSREEAVQVGNQALLVQAMQGNMNSARQIALDTAKFANDDRKAELDNLITQYNALDGIVTGQEKQLIDQKKADAEAEKAELERTQATTDSAILSGGATVEEMQQLTSTTATNEEKLALSQSIVARTAGSDRALDRAVQGASLENSRLTSRKNLFDLALVGDTQAISSLGYDPRTMTKESVEEKRKEEAVYDNAVDVVSVAERALENTLGLQASVSPNFVTQAIGRAVLAPQAVFGEGEKGKSLIDLENEFKASVGKLLEKEVLDTLANLPVKLTPMTDADVAIVRRSANELGGLVDLDKAGNVKRLRGSEQEIIRLITNISTSYANIVDVVNRESVSSDEISEINNLMNQQ